MSGGLQASILARLLALAKDRGDDSLWLPTEAAARKAVGGARRWDPRSATWMH